MPPRRKGGRRDTRTPQEIREPVSLMSLPDELLAKVADYVHQLSSNSCEERRSLAVCRRWHSLAQARMDTRIEGILVQSLQKALQQVIGRSQFAKRLRSIDVDLLHAETTKDDVNAFADDLRRDELDQPSWSDIVWRHISIVAWQALFNIVLAAPNLEKIVIEFLDYEPTDQVLDAANLYDSLRTCPHLTSLHLTFPLNNSCEIFLGRILAACAGANVRLRSLGWVRAAWYLEESTANGAWKAVVSGTRTLRISAQTDESSFACLIEAMPLLTTFSVDLDDSESDFNGPDLASALQLLVPRFQHFEVRYKRTSAHFSSFVDTLAPSLKATKSIDLEGFVAGRTVFDALPESLTRIALDSLEPYSVGIFIANLTTRWKSLERVAIRRRRQPIADSDLSAIARICKSRGVSFAAPRY